MKPKNETVSQIRPSRFEEPSKTRASRFSLISFNFQPLDGADLRAPDLSKKSSKIQHESFWTISQRFLQRDAQKEFALEALSFLAISLIAAWPLAALIEVLIRTPR